MVKLIFLCVCILLTSCSTQSEKCGLNYMLKIESEYVCKQYFFSGNDYAIVNQRIANGFYSSFKEKKVNDRLYWIGSYRESMSEAAKPGFYCKLGDEVARVDKGTFGIFFEIDGIAYASITEQGKWQSHIFRLNNSNYRRVLTLNAIISSKYTNYHDELTLIGSKSLGVPVAYKFKENQVSELKIEVQESRQGMSRLGQP